MSTKLKSVLLITIPIILAFTLSLILQFTVLAQPEKFTNWLSSFGPFVILIYAILQPVTIIIAPIGGFFMYIAVIAIFKPFWGLVLVYCVTTPSYIVNFYLAKRYGRPIVEKLIGKKGMSEVDKYTDQAGLPTLIFLRIFQAGLFDYISYGAGLTDISLKKFVIVNILGGIPASLVSYFILTRFSNFTLSIIALTLTSYVLILISVLVNYYRRKHK